MALAKRSNDTRVGGLPSRSPGDDAGYNPGGRVGDMHAELAQHFMAPDPSIALVDSPAERVVRFISVAGGYVGLLAAYGWVAWLFLR